jgi:hypothetical protein
MTVVIANDRKVKVGDKVTLIGGRWYNDEGRIFKAGEVMTVIENDDDTEFFMNEECGDITVEIEAVRIYPNNFM